MSFRVLKVSIDGQEHELSYPLNGDENYITVMTGKNGSGKSSILEFISSNFVKNDDFLRYHPERWSRGFNKISDGYNENTITYKSGGYKVVAKELSKELAMAFISRAHPENRYEVFPTKLICLSTSPFDRFPANKRRLKYENDEEVLESIYTYIGLKSSASSLSVKSLINNVIDSILKSPDRIRSNIDVIKDTLSYLGYGKRIRLTFKSNMPPSTLFSGDKSAVLDWLINNHCIEPNLSFNEQTDKLLLATSTLRAKHNNVKGQFSVSIRLSEEHILNDEYIASVRMLLSSGVIRMMGFKLSLKEDNRKFITFSHASSGEQCLALMMLGIASVIENNSLICMDEPEISLHPKWQEEFIPMIQKAFNSYRGCHFIIATHSPLIISKLNSQNCSVLDLDRNELVNKFNTTEFSSDYQLATLFKAPGFKNQYLVNECLDILSHLSKSADAEASIMTRSKKVIELISTLDENDPVYSLASTIQKVIEE
ncbi:ATP-binding protein [Photobacterium alginatilyticum]|uniref:ATP-binding protein n=1 Tax=Photobacterium alginatilyticum TaxID=1775171 RepID=A0ABW9YR92_9GAMM|nr:ATP-binding protein [Photobacterium alginatilyticum]NBI55551.1 ATP-binding protein [Photobacterium alginatilyticum]